MSSIDKEKEDHQASSGTSHPSAASDSSAKTKGLVSVAKPLDKGPADSTKGILHITTKYTSGMELLIQGKALELEHYFAVDPKAEAATMKDLIKYVSETHVLRGKQEAFTRAESVCPGIMVIVNGCDWEVMDELEYKLENNDVVEFISTLHGG
ncbi:hypothetical protein GGI20_005196 [Coemansia sp. BCRC 34301]|nr:hypothetical protein GGI20_005196 [Coemansia sp. BCRC 34301]